MQSTLPPLLQATSGAVGSAVANAIVYPLDIATTRMQHESNLESNSKRSHGHGAGAGKANNTRRLGVLATLYRLIRSRGLSRLYHGLSADTLSTLLANFLYFLTYASLQKALHIYQTRYHPSSSLIPFPLPSARTRPQTQTSVRGGSTASPAGIGGLATKASDLLPRPSKPSPVGDLIVGMLAGVVSKGVTLPISTVCVRQQLDDKRQGQLSLIETLETINHESGLSGLFAGFAPTIPLTLLPSLTLYIHTLLLRYALPRRHQAHPPGHVTFMLGAASNALATLPLYPLVLLKVLSQAGKGKGKQRDDGHGQGMIGTLQGILEKDGIGGLYTGLEGQLVKGIVQQGVMMLVKQRVEEAIVRVYRSRS